jgi:hypothetical protein
MCDVDRIAPLDGIIDRSLVVMWETKGVWALLSS